MVLLVVHIGDSQGDNVIMSRYELEVKSQPDADTLANLFKRNGYPVEIHPPGVQPSWEAGDWDIPSGLYPALKSEARKDAEYTVWVATHEEGYTYTGENFDLFSRSDALEMEQILGRNGHTVMMLPKGDVPTWYQSPTDTEPMSASDWAANNLDFLDDADIPKHMVMAVFDNEGKLPHFAYTVGLAARDWPELLLVGLDAQSSALILNEIAARFIHPPLGPIDIGGDYKLMALPVGDLAGVHDVYTCQAALGPVTQIIMPDTKGKYPWEDDCDEPYSKVPILGIQKPELGEGQSPF